MITLTHFFKKSADLKLFDLVNYKYAQIMFRTSKNPYPQIYKTYFMIEMCIMLTI